MYEILLTADCSSTGALCYDGEINAEALSQRLSLVTVAERCWHRLLLIVRADLA
jgi:hypothetical protein